METETQILKLPEQDRVTIPPIIATSVLETKKNETWDRGMVSRSPDLLFVYGETQCEFKRMDGKLDKDGLWHAMGHVTKQLKHDTNIRGATNAFPIRIAWFAVPPGKRKYQECMGDRTLRQNKKCIKEDVDIIIEAFKRKPYRFIVLPGNGIGLVPGFIHLSLSAPKTYSFLQRQLQRFKNM